MQQKNNNLWRNNTLAAALETQINIQKAIMGGGFTINPVDITIAIFDCVQL